jgi:hypothetical protein
LQTIVSNDYTPFDGGDFESETTLILGANFVDGVVLMGVLGLRNIAPEPKPLNILVSIN